MTAKITIGIPTCGRIQAIKDCLESISNYVDISYQIIIVDSMKSDENLEIYNQYPHTRCLAFDSPIGPSAARKLIIDNADTPYTLFLDDDNQVNHGTVSLMLNYLENHPDVDIVGGAWREDGGFEKRELGQYFHFGTSGDRQIVYKSFVTVADTLRLNLDSVKVDATGATMLIRKETFERVSFDPQFDFYFELFDFFMQCRDRGVNIYALPNAVFEHKPITYAKSTLRQSSKTENDRQKFIDKWGRNPVGQLGGNQIKKKQNIVKRLIKKIKSI